MEWHEDRYQHTLAGGQASLFTGLNETPPGTFV